MLSRKKQEMMKERLVKERDELLRQREALDNQIKGIERAIALVGTELPQGSSDVASQSSGRRVATKAIVLDLLKDVGTTGLTAQTAVDMAKNHGHDLDRSSVSSLLSRLKKDDVVFFDRERYRLKMFEPSKQSVFN